LFFPVKNSILTAVNENFYDKTDTHYMTKTFDSYPVDIDRDEFDSVAPDVVGIIPIEGNVAFPHIIFPVTIREEPHVKLVKDAIEHEGYIGVFTRNISILPDDKNDSEDLFETGVLCQILKFSQPSEGHPKVLLQGIDRIQISEFLKKNPFAIARVEVIHDGPYNMLQAEAYIRTISDLFQQIMALTPIFPEELQDVLFSIEEPAKLGDLIASALNIRISEKQSLLEESNVLRRLSRLVKMLKKELKLIELNAKIHDKVNTAISENQREFFLREQLRAIQNELGEGPEETDEVAEIRDKMSKIHLSNEAIDSINKELDRLGQMHPSSPEYTVSRNYIDWMLELPWGLYSKHSIKLSRAERILNEDHFGLEDIKDRILEFLAVLQLKPSAKSPIICFVGPPGVGKTSLGKSIARAMGREFVRFSLGGMHDEAEIRGHRKTYIGAMPGRIIQYIRRAGVQNPVIMLDEVDKIGKDFRGDPSSALLEVLDPEQNKDFRDNYLEVAFDLSRVTFLATSNTTHTIPDALLDRMELIHLPGYINPEKVEIAKRYLIPRQIEANGLKKGQVRFYDPVIEKIIDHYTFESGVRNLEQHIAKICRKLARKMASGTELKKFTITEKNIESFLGPRKIFNEDISKSDAIGVVNGLAYTAAGGDVLSVEAVIMKGSGNQKMTGQLGDVMKESVSTAISFLRSRATEFKIETERFKEFDIHLHFPAASIPKDGPSAGVSIVTAVASLLTERPVRHHFAMSGEITLQGKVLAVGGIREKVTAARRYGITDVILPESNRGDVEKTPDYVKEGIQFHYVKSVDDVFNLALNPKYD